MFNIIEDNYPVKISRSISPSKRAAVFPIVSNDKPTPATSRGTSILVLQPKLPFSNSLTIQQLDFSSIYVSRTISV
jgi:hypothetical protein